MSWNLKGSYAETCACELMCPCNLSLDHGATYDFCRVTLVFEIREGEVEGTDVSGLNVALIADTPKVMTEGNWKLGVFVDERASEEQGEKLVQVFSGQAGGPMAGLAPLVGEVVGVERAAISHTIADGAGTLTVGDKVDCAMEPYRGPDGSATTLNNSIFSTVPGSPAYVAKASHERVDVDGIGQWELEGKNAIQSDWKIDYRGE